MQMMSKDIFWPIIDSSSFYATGGIRGQNAVLRVVTSDHVRDKDGGQTIRSGMAENPCCTQTARLYRL